MTIHVFHITPKQPDNAVISFLGLPKEKVLAAVQGMDEDFRYELVAEVETDDLDKAFELTNHISRDWRTNASLRAMPAARRSTSVGDLLEKDGRKYLVAMFGFKEIGDAAH